MKLSVLIATYNRAEVLRQTLEAICLFCCGSEKHGSGNVAPERRKPIALGKAAFLVCVSLLGWESACAAGLTVVFRLDDYSETSDLREYEEVFSLFEERGVPLTVGIIPYVRSGSEELALGAEHADFIRDYIERGEVEAALHGYSHRDNVMLSGGSTNGEFPGMPYEEQFRKIRMGKSHLENRLGCAVQIFIPPFNAYDHDTLKACAQAGIEILSSSRGDLKGTGSQLLCIPFTSNLWNVREAVAFVGDKGLENVSIIVLFHMYDFSEAENKSAFSLGDLKEMLDFLLSDSRISIRSLGMLASREPQLDWTAFQNDSEHIPIYASSRDIRRWRLPYSLIPWHAGLEYSLPYPMPPRILLGDRIVLVMAALAYTLIASFSGIFILAAVRFCRVEFRARSVIALLGIIALFAAYVGSQGGTFGYRKASVLAVLIGGLLATIWQIWPFPGKPGDGMDGKPLANEKRR